MIGDDFDSDLAEAADEPAAPLQAAPDVADELPPAKAPRKAAEGAGEDEEHETEGFTHEGEPGYEQDDPLAPGFDIDEGTPLSRSGRGSGLPIRGNVKSAKEFFNAEILYRFDILEDEARTELAGTYRIELKGFQGGIWTITVGEQLDVVNRREEADLVMTMQQRDFLQLVNGQLNPQLAIFAQKLRVTGDVRKAVAFQALLSPEID